MADDRWIWEEQRKHHCGADGVLDTFRVLEHVAQTRKVLHADSQTCKQWCDQASQRLLHAGYAETEEFTQRNIETHN